MTKTLTNVPLNFGGSRTTIRLSHGGDARGVAITEHDMPCGYAPPLHVHVNQDEVFQVLKGSITVEVDGTLFRARPGDILRAPMGVPHRFIVDDPEGARVLVTTVGGDFEAFVREASVPMSDARLSPLTAPTTEEIDRQTRAAVRNWIEMIGPPLTLEDIRQRAA
jgi:quercetin dioxygenase-like cupin family protein